MATGVLLMTVTLECSWFLDIGVSRGRIEILLVSTLLVVVLLIVWVQFYFIHMVLEL